MLKSTASIPQQLQTCRYWALGPHCPDVVDGVSYCWFAHRITPHLASAIEQPGTCFNFNRNGVCQYGDRCRYEHRDCGVTGLGQGIIELHGLEFEIANAAFQAGFNTANHEALFNLIWALKRAGDRCFGSSGESRLPLPQHPIYADRYRPSGFGDNTMKKRKLTADSQPEIHSIPLGQKGNTKDDPIAIDDDPWPIAQTIARRSTSPRKSAEAVARLKSSIKNGSQDRTLDVDEFAKEYTPWNMVSSANQPTKKTGSNRLELGKPNRLLENRTQSRSLPMRPADKHVSQQQAGDIPTTPPCCTKTVDAPMSAEEEIVEALSHVNLELVQTKNAMNRCQEDMRNLFDRHPGQLRDEQKILVLRSLANDMNSAWEAAKAGMSDIEMVLALMEKGNSDNTL